MITVIIIVEEFCCASTPEFKMTNLIAGLTATTLYLGGLVYYIFKLRSSIEFNLSRLQVITALALLAHLVATIYFLLAPEGLDLSLLKIFVLIALAINLIVFASGLTKIQHTLYLVLFPISAGTLLMATVVPSSSPILILSTNMQAHILFSILAYSLLSIAALQALFIGVLDWQLKRKRRNLLIRTLPPLETMELVLFNVILVGQFFLTLSLLSGLAFYDFFATNLLPKAILSCLAWLFNAILLYGRYYRGWRGRIAIRLTWAGFSSLLIAYIGTKFVFEYVVTG